MKIELTKLEQNADLAGLLQTIEETHKEDLSVPMLGLTRILRSVTRIALWTRAALTQALDGKRAACEEADRLKEQLDKVLDHLNFVKGERDKLAAEIENWSFGPATAFSEALQSIGDYHDKLIRDAVGQPVDIDDPFDHQALSDKHGMPLDSYPLMEVEKVLRDEDMGSVPSWRKIAHQAVLALSYLRPKLSEEHEAGLLESTSDADEGDDCKEDYIPAA